MQRLMSLFEDGEPALWFRTSNTFVVGGKYSGGLRELGGGHIHANVITTKDNGTQSSNYVYPRYCGYLCLSYERLRELA